MGDLLALRRVRPLRRAVRAAAPARDEGDSPLHCCNTSCELWWQGKTLAEVSQHFYVCCEPGGGAGEEEEEEEILVVNKMDPVLSSTFEYRSGSQEVEKNEKEEEHEEAVLLRRADSLLQAKLDIQRRSTGLNQVKMSQSAVKPHFPSQMETSLKRRTLELSALESLIREKEQQLAAREQLIRTKSAPIVTLEELDDLLLDL